MQPTELKEILGVQSKNIFYAGADERGKHLVIVKDKESVKQLAKLLKQLSQDYPLLSRSKIKIASSLGLGKAVSLESLLQSLPHAQILYDPTRTIERAKALFEIAKQVRNAFPYVKGCYFNSETRHIHFTLDNQTSVQNGMEIRHSIETIIVSQLQKLTKTFACKITLATLLPQGTVIPIDRKSIRKQHKQLLQSLVKKMKWSLFVASLSSIFGITPAKAAPHQIAWLGLKGGSYHNNLTSGPGAFVEGGFATPFADNLGVQVEGFDGGAAHENLWMLGGYVFWRDPLVGILGPHLTYAQTSGWDQTLFGVHGERFIDEWTIVGEVGGQHTNTSNNGIYGEAIVHWYNMPNWDLNLGAIVIKDDVGGQLGTEYQFGLNALPGLSLFADVGAGSHSLYYGYLGLRYYFGENKSLVLRHREDKIPPTLDLFMLGQERAKAPAFVS